MKNFLAILIMIGFVNCALAQDTASIDIFANGVTIDSVIRHFKSFVTTADTGEGSYAARLAEFEMFWRDRAVANDGNGNMFQQYYGKLQQAVQAKLTAGNCNNSNAFSGAWKNIGPNESPEQVLGRIDAVWADPNDSTDVLAATYGGLFRSSKVNGNWKWTCITDNSPIAAGIISPSFIAVHPTNHDIIYLGTWTFYLHVVWPQFQWPFPYGGALFYTVDGGQHWNQETIPLNSTDLMDKLKLIPLVYFSPDGTRLYAFADGKLYFRNYPNGTVWNDITPTTNSTAWSDLQFVPGSSTDFYASVLGSGSGATQIWHFNYANGTHTSSQVNIPYVNFLSGTSNDFKSIKLSLPTSSMLYTILQKTGSTDVALMSYNMVTQTWTAVNNAIPAHQDQCNSCFNLIASPNNSNVFYYGVEDLYASVNGGQYFNKIGTYGGNPTHGDTRGMYLQHSENSANGWLDRVYFANDGGVSLKPRGNDPTLLGSSTTTNINGKGLAAGHIVGLGTSEDAGEIIIGAWHSGQQAYEPSLQSKWGFRPGNDGSDGIFTRDKMEGYATTDHGSALEKAVSGSGRKINGYSCTTSILVESGDEKTPKWADQFGGIYFGLTNMWRLKPGNLSSG